MEHDITVPVWQQTSLQLHMSWYPDVYYYALYSNTTASTMKEQPN